MTHLRQAWPPYRVAHGDRVPGAVPRLGYAIGRLTTLAGRFALCVYGAFLVLVLGGPLELTQASGGWAAWSDSSAVTGTTLSTHSVLPPTSVSCTGGGPLASLAYSWPSKDSRYTYRAEVVDSTGTVRRTDLVPESGQADYGVTYAVGDLPLGNFTVRVSSFLTASASWTSTTTTSAGGSKTAVLLGLSTACG